MQTKAFSKYNNYLVSAALRYLNEQGVKHEWVPFVKTGTDAADFIIKGVSIDLKCSSGDNLWLTPFSPHDIYISAQITQEHDYLYINGWLPNELISSFKDIHATMVIRGSRVAYVLSNEYMLPTHTLEGVFTSSSPSSKFMEVKR